MLKKLRKSSERVTLVLIGVAALAGCADNRRDVYATREDCLADWGNTPQECTPATDSRHAGRGHFYGPVYGGSGFGSGWGNRSGGTFSSARSTSGRSIGSASSSSSSRGGFGSSGRSSSIGS